MKPVVFLGPTLGLEEARQILDAIYLPPARQADIVSCVGMYSPSSIALIDGYFEQSLSVWHKEILHALSCDIPVYGASSMGALRAAELEKFGMIGVGDVFQAYRRGLIDGDDEVALRHGDADSGYLALSLPLINIRATLSRAESVGAVDRSTAQDFIEVVAGLHFPDRVPATIAQAAHEAGIDQKSIDKILGRLESHYVDLKKQDAVQLLETVGRIAERPRIETRVELAQSPLFETLHERERRVRRSDGEVSLERIVEYAALHRGDFSEIAFAAMNRALAQVLAGLFDVSVSAEEVEIESQRFRLRHALEDPEGLAAWLERNDLSRGEYMTLMREVAVCRRLHRWLIEKKRFSRNAKVLLDQLRLDNTYQNMADSSALEARILGRHHPDFPRGSRPGPSLEELVQEQVRSTDFKLDTNVATYADEVGFHSLGDLEIALLRSHLARAAMKEVLAKAWPRLEDPDPES